MKRFARLLTFTCAAFAMHGCSLFTSDTKVKPAELTEFKATDELAPLWRESIGKAGDFVFTPAVVDDSVYAAGENGKVARYDKGREVWTIDVDQHLSGGVGSDGKIVAVGTSKGDVLAFDAESGKPLWQARVSSEVLAAPAIGEGLVVVRSGDSRIAGLDARDGKRRWVYQRATPALSLRTNVGLLVGQRVSVAGFPGGKLVAISNQNGAAIWEVAVAQPKGSTELERIADLASSPVVDGREICAAAFQGRVACFDIATGNQLWSRDVSSSAGIDMDKQRVYVSDDKGTVHAFARDSGASLWKQDKLFMRGLTRPIALGRRVAVADYKGVVHLLNAEDGNFTARATTDDSAVRADPQHYGDGFIVQTVDGGLFAFKLH
ncbi:MAG TPA: outer membrane protein assembly factor BamB [Rhodocyclaceae bacterium]|nr:outer membrane protein assembly factor BamB [Rhodocyclaceae bacterium]